MNKAILAVVVAGGLIVLGGWWYTSNQQAEDKAMMEEQAMTEKAASEKATLEQKAMMEKEAETPAQNDAMMKKDEGAMMVKGGQYVAYDASKLTFAQEGKVVLFFRASWCPTCRALDADIKANLSRIPQNVLILDVDYDQSSDLKKRYGVTYQHTLVQVDAMGNVIAKWSGSAGLDELVKQVR